MLVPRPQALCASCCQPAGVTSHRPPTTRRAGPSPAASLHSFLPVDNNSKVLQHTRLRQAIIASVLPGVQLLGRWLFARLKRASLVVVDPLAGSLLAAIRTTMAALAGPTLFDMADPNEDRALVPYVSHLTAKEQLAVRIHIYLLFSPGQVRVKPARLRHRLPAEKQAADLLLAFAFFPGGHLDAARAPVPKSV